MEIENDFFDTPEAEEIVRTVIDGKTDEAIAKIKATDLQISDIRARYIIGVLLLRRPEVDTQVFEIAVNLIRDCSDSGDAAAQTHLAQLYAFGVNLDQDSEKAISLWSRAANQYYLPAIHYLSKAYQGGLPNVEQNYPQAIEYMGKAGFLGDSEALVTLGHAYSNGDLGVEKSYEKSNEYYFQALKLGNVKAAHNLALAYENGYGLDQNYEAAAELYTVSAKSRSPLSMHNLAALHFNNKVSEVNYDFATFMYHSASALGSHLSSYVLSIMYAKGQILKHDSVRALGMYMLAREQGNSEDGSHINEIASRMSEQEIERAVYMSKNFPENFKREIDKSDFFRATDYQKQEKPRST